MVDLRRVAIIFVIAVLYVVLVNALIGAVHVQPQYQDYCNERFYPERPAPVGETKSCPDYALPPQEQLDECSRQGGSPDYQRDANGCAIAYTGCNLCQQQYEQAQERYNLTVFIISSLLAMIAIAVGLLLPLHKSLNEWIATGFMLGGLLALFIGTFRYYEYLGRYLKPVIILLELMLVIYLAYRRLDETKSPVRAKGKRS